MTEGLYARLSEWIRDAYFPTFGHTEFTADDIFHEFKRQHPVQKFKHLEGKLVDRNTRLPLLDGDITTVIAKFLWEVTDNQKKPLLRRLGYKRFKLIDRTVKTLDWASGEGVLPLIFPKDRDTEMELPFVNNIEIYAGDLICIAGESNRGKSTLCWNFALENMDKFDVIMWISEFHPAQTRKRMAFSNMFREDGSPRVETLRLDDVYELAQKIADKPNSLHIIDWIGLRDKFFAIGGILEDIQNALTGGIAIISIQKNESHQLGAGGELSKHNISLYMTVSKLSDYYQRLKLEKVKSPNGSNPEFKSYRFACVSNGGQIADVAEIEDCRVCTGKKYVKGEPCSACDASGYKIKSFDPF